MGSAAMGTEGMVTDVLDESASRNGQGFASSAQDDYFKDRSRHQQDRINNELMGMLKYQNSEGQPHKR